MARQTQVAPDAFDDRSPQSGDAAGREGLEQRLERLEHAIASLQDIHGLEQRIAERIERQLEVRRPEAPHEEKVTARKKFSVPLLAGFLPPPRGTENAAPAPEELAKLPQAASLLGVSPQAVHEVFWAWEVLRELRLMLRMFLDVSYRVAWWVRIFAVVMLLAMLTAHLWVPLSAETWILGFPGRILQTLVVVILGFFFYKVLSREAKKYQTYQALKQQALLAAELRQQAEMERKG
jgi:hypothetical protein